MRDLFGVRKEINNKENKLELLMEEILELKNQITEMSIGQQKDRQIILEQQSILEKTILNQEIQMPELSQSPPEILSSEEDNYIMLDEPEEPKITEIREKYKDPLEEEIVKSIAKNKKTIIKQKILAIASKQRTTSKQVKEFIVDKYKYCSKATFYRYLSELKKQHKLETISVNNKEYVCNITIDKKQRSF